MRGILVSSTVLLIISVGAREILRSSPREILPLHTIFVILRSWLGLDLPKEQGTVSIAHDGCYN